MSPKHNSDEIMSNWLVVTREVQVDVRHLVTMEAFLKVSNGMFCPSLTIMTWRKSGHFYQQVPRAGGMLPFSWPTWAAVVRRHRVDFSDTHHGGNQAGTSGTPGANQVAVLS